MITRHDPYAQSAQLLSMRLIADRSQNCYNSSYSFDDVRGYLC